MADEDTDISRVSNITDLATYNEIPSLRDSKTPEEIFKNICNDLREAGRQVKSTIRQFASANLTNLNVEKTVILPEITSTLHHKASIINKLTNNIKDSNDLGKEDFIQFRNEAIMSLPITMVEETSGSVNAVDTLHRLRKENDDYLKLLSETEELLTEMESTEMNFKKGISEFVKIQKRTKEDYKGLRQDLTYVTDTLFEDETLSNDMYALLEDLVKKSQSQNEADEWYELVDTRMMPLVMMLYEAGATVANLQDSKFMKLIV